MGGNFERFTFCTEFASTTKAVLLTGICTYIVCSVHIDATIKVRLHIIYNDRL